MLTVSGETKKKRQRSGRSGARLHIFCGRAAHEDMGMLYTYTHARYGTSTSEGKGARYDRASRSCRNYVDNLAVVDECCHP